MYSVFHLLQALVHTNIVYKTTQNHTFTFRSFFKLYVLLVCFTCTQCAEGLDEKKLGRHTHNIQFIGHRALPDSLDENDYHQYDQQVSVIQQNRKKEETLDLNMLIYSDLFSAWKLLHPSRIQVVQNYYLDLFDEAATANSPEAPQKEQTSPHSDLADSQEKSLDVKTKKIVLVPLNDKDNQKVLGVPNPELYSADLYVLELPQLNQGIGGTQQPLILVSDPYAGPANITLILESSEFAKLLNFSNQEFSLIESRFTLNFTTECTPFLADAVRTSMQILWLATLLGGSFVIAYSDSLGGLVSATPQLPMLRICSCILALVISVRILDSAISADCPWTEQTVERDQAFLSLRQLFNVVASSFEYIFMLLLAVGFCICTASMGQFKFKVVFSLAIFRFLFQEASAISGMFPHLQLTLVVCQGLFELLNIIVAMHYSASNLHILKTLRIGYQATLQEGNEGQGQLQRQRILNQIHFRIRLTYAFSALVGFYFLIEFIFNVTGSAYLLYAEKTQLESEYTLTKVQIQWLYWQLNTCVLTIATVLLAKKVQQRSWLNPSGDVMAVNDSVLLQPLFHFDEQFEQAEDADITIEEYLHQQISDQIQLATARNQQILYVYESESNRGEYSLLDHTSGDIELSSLGEYKSSTTNIENEMHTLETALKFEPNCPVLILAPDDRSPQQVDSNDQEILQVDFKKSHSIQIGHLLQLPDINCESVPSERMPSKQRQESAPEYDTDQYELFLTQVSNTTGDLVNQVDELDLI